MNWLGKNGLWSEVGLIANTCWSLWKARNELMFDNRACDSIATWNRALLDNPCVSEGSDQMKPVHNVSENQRWRKPTFGTVKINCDALMDSGSPMTGVKPKICSGPTHSKQSNYKKNKLRFHYPNYNAQINQNPKVQMAQNLKQFQPNKKKDRNPRCAAHRSTRAMPSHASTSTAPYMQEG